MSIEVTFRFYEGLNDFLSKSFRKRAFHICLNGNPSVKDSIESLGVPHTEIDLILVNGNIKIVSKQSIDKILQPLTRKYYDELYRCTECNKIYWKGSHVKGIYQLINQLKNNL
jgi:hypothetical protein